MTAPARDLSKTFLSILLLCLLLGGSLWILRPFVLPTLWATMLVVATWPILRGLQKLFGGRRGPAVATMTVSLLLLLLVPMGLVVIAVITNADDIGKWVQSLATWQVPAPPGFLAKIPLAGEKLVGLWQAAEAGGPGYLTARLSPYVSDAVHWLLSSAGSVGLIAVEFLITVIVASILYASGEGAAKGVRLFAKRLMGQRGDEIVTLSGQAIRGVALGVVLTAIVQSVAAGIGLALAGIPYSLALTAFCFVLCVAQLGPVPVMIPATIWIFWDKGTVWGIAFLVWSVLVGMINNVLQPVLIKRGADLPMILVFAGVIGGLLSFGIIGIFVGPVLLAVAYSLLGNWVTDEPVA